MQKFTVVVLSLLFGFSLHAQSDTISIKVDSVLKRTYKVGIFAPLYLDSVFTGNNFRYSKNFPRFILQGLDFVQGAEIALDSMPFTNGNIDASIYDSKSASENIQSLISKKKIDSLDLIIGSVKDEDYTQLANFALQKNIPFISATYPNDGGVNDNPFLVIVNSTLKAHCEAIYSYILQNQGTARIFLCRKPGSQEDRVAGYFNKINQPDNKTLLNIETINIVDSNFNSIKYKLDSNNRNIIIAASLDEYFAFALSTEAAELNKTYPITLIGMPNWDGFKSFSKKNDFANYPVYFTSPFYNGKWDNRSKMIKDIYLKKYKGVPSDYTYKGYETVYTFSTLLTKYPVDFISHLNDCPTKVFSEYNFKPVFNSGTDKPDYFENKHLYFLKIENGKVSRAW
ncbi:MAG: ABC transporter substrate-binding protein [Ferruginibacter sp.]